MQSLIHIDKDAFNHMNDNIQDLTTNVKIIQKDIDQFHKLTDKMDTTNDNLQKLIFEVQRIVAIHEQKLTAQGDYSDYLDKRIDTHIKESSDQHEKIEKKNTMMDEKIQRLERVKWIMLGAFSAISFAIQMLIQFFAK